MSLGGAFGFGFGIPLQPGVGSVGSDPIAQILAMGFNIAVDADPSRVTKDGSDRISAVSSFGSASMTWSQGTAGNKPLWVANGTPNGKPIIRLEDAARTLLCSSGVPSNTNAAQTHLVVIKRSAAGIFMRHANAASTAGLYVFREFGGNKIVTCLGSTSITDGAVTANWEVWCLRIAASGGYGTAVTTAQFRVNGVNQTFTGTPNLSQGTDSHSIGHGGSSGVADIAMYFEATGT
jgi:hypothetical protein